MVGKSILLTLPVSLLCWDTFQISKCSDELMWQLYAPSLSAVTVCRCHSCRVVSASNYHHLVLVSNSCMGVGACVWMRLS